MIKVEGIIDSIKMMFRLLVYFANVPASAWAVVAELPSDGNDTGGVLMTQD